MKRQPLLLILILTLQTLTAQNPFMPLWEHIPDGEPHVFDDPDRPGHKRVYIYGSHDDLVTDYCGLNQVVWSAPVDDLTNWRYDGVCFTNVVDGKADLLYAPDIVEVVENGKKVYYFMPNNQAKGREGMIARGERPDGPFTAINNPASVFRFDPAILRDDDGRMYGYWGFRRSYAAELDPVTMCTMKPGTKIVTDMVSGVAKGQQGIFRFFEASSIRKIQNKYVFIYSRFTGDGEFGLPTANYNLAYAYSDHPLGPWSYGGTIIDARGRDTDEQGFAIATNYNCGNTHGSIFEANGQWWVVYHRHTGTTEYARQAMVAPIDVKVKKDGRVIITECEVTSEGFRTEGLNPLERTAAGWACHFTGPKPMTNRFPNFFPTGSYPAATHNGNDMLRTTFSQNHPHTPMVNNTSGSIIGYKYFRTDALAKHGTVSIDLHLKPLAIKGEIIFMLDSPYKSRGGTELGTLALTGNEQQTAQHLTTVLTGLKGKKGKHALYLIFRSDTKDKSLCDLYDFIFTI